MLLCGEREYSMNNFYLVAIKSRLARPAAKIIFITPSLITHKCCVLTLARDFQACSIEWPTCRYCVLMVAHPVSVLALHISVARKSVATWSWWYQHNYHANVRIRLCRVKFLPKYLMILCISYAKIDTKINCECKIWHIKLFNFKEIVN